MTPIPELAAPDNGEGPCTIPECGQPTSFRIRLDRSRDPSCGCESRSADVCAAHLIDAIHQLAQWARAQCPHPADVTVYVAEPPTEGIPSIPHGFAFATIHVPE